MKQDNIRLVDIVDVDPYVDTEHGNSIFNEHTLELPEVIGILPIRSAVAYPGTIMPLAIGRKRSKRLIEDSVPHETIFGLVAQRDADIDNPGPDDIYTVGTAASVLKVIRMPQGSINIIVHGIARFRILEVIATKPYMKARVSVLNVKTRMTKKLQALMVNVRNAADRIIASARQAVYL